MDIRIASYNPGTARPVNITTVTKQGNPMATAYVQNAAQSGPVEPVSRIESTRGGTQTANGDGYTDSVRGSLVNILA